MKLSVWSSYYHDLSPEDAVLEFLKNGINACELSTEHADVLLARGDAKKVGADFKKFCDENGMCIHQGHLFLEIRLCDETKPIVDILKTWLDLFLAIGIKRAVLHCDSMIDNITLLDEEKRERNVAVIKQLTDYLKGTDLVICLENIVECCATVEELLWYIDRIGSDNLGICLDTGHLNLTVRHHVDFIKKAGKHLKALHIANNQGVSDQHMMPFSRGSVDFVAIAKALREIGYDDLYNLEIPGETGLEVPGGCPLEVRGYKLEYIRKVYEYLVR